MKIKTKESLQTIKTFERTGGVVKNGRHRFSELNKEADGTNSGAYESESEYAGERANINCRIFGGYGDKIWGKHKKIHSKRIECDVFEIA